MSLSWKPPNAKGSESEARTEGPFLKWQNCGSKVAKVSGERGDPRPPQRVGGDERDSSQTTSRTKAAPWECESPGVWRTRPENRAWSSNSCGSRHRQAMWGRREDRAQSPSWQPD